MWIKEVFLGFIGLTSGLAVSAAVFAFVITVGIVPRFAGKTHTSRYVLVYEHAILLGEEGNGAALRYEGCCPQKERMNGTGRMEL